MEQCDSGMTPLQIRTAGLGVVFMLLCAGISFAQNLEDSENRSQRFRVGEVLRAVSPAEPAHLLLNPPGALPSVNLRPSVSSKDSTLYHDLPSITGEYTVRGTKLMPYVGAGFGNGYSSDLDRALNRGTAVQSDTSTGSFLGPNMTPNELRMGIQIPF